MITNVTVGENGFLYLHGTLSEWCYLSEAFRNVRGPFRLHRSASQVRDYRGEIITLERLQQGAEVFSIRMYCKSSYKGDYRQGVLYVESIDPKSDIGLTILRHWREWLEFEDARLKDLYEKQQSDAGLKLASIERVPARDKCKNKRAA